MNRWISALFVVSLLLLSACSSEIRDDDGSALLALYFNGWSDDLFDSNKAYFYFDLHNYGVGQATDIVVFCYAFDDNDTILLKTAENVGSLIHFSKEEYNISARIPDGIKVNETTGYCLIKSCNGCELIQNRIPVYNENYEFWRRFW